MCIRDSLKPAEGSTKTRKRIGRGPGSGLGGTSTRGHKGATSRSGYSTDVYKRQDLRLELLRNNRLSTLLREEKSNLIN